MRASHAAVVMLLPIALAACGDSSPAIQATPSATVITTPASSASTPATAPVLGPLRFQVAGSCTSAGGTLYGVGSGFTSNGPYVTQVTYPDGKPYNVPDPEGTASADGATPKWAWPCNYQGKGDPPGKYTVTIIDRTTNRSATTTFTVGKP